MTVALTALVMLPAAPAGAAITLPPLPCVPGVTCPKPTPKPVCAHADVIPAAGNIATIRRATLCLLNVERTKHHLAKLHANRALRGVATAYAKRMVANSFFGHVSPTGSTFVQRILSSRYLEHANGYNIGENLAWGADPLSTPKLIVRAWMHSPGHRANILNGHYRDIGIGLALGIPVAGNGAGATYVNEFGQHG
jgi:uncharacterized protein YkwD